MTIQKIQGHDNLYKNSNTGVINNRSSSDRERYRLAKQQSVDNITLRQEVNELKALVKQLLER